MVQFRSIAGPLSVAFLLLGGAQGRCDFIHWQIDAGFGGEFIHGTIFGSPNRAEIDLVPMAAPNQSGDARVPLVDVGFFVKGEYPYRPIKAEGDYVMSLFLTDMASHSTTTLKFPGHMSGQIGGDQPAAFAANRFLGPTTQTAILGGNVYTINLESFAFASAPALPAPPVGFAAELSTMSVFVDVHPAAQNAPEPTCLALAGMGLGCLAVVRMRRTAAHRWTAWLGKAVNGFFKGMESQT